MDIIKRISEMFRNGYLSRTMEPAMMRLRIKEKTDWFHYGVNASQIDHATWRHERDGKRTDKKGCHLYVKPMELLKKYLQGLFSKNIEQSLQAEDETCKTASQELYEHK